MCLVGCFCPTVCHVGCILPSTNAFLCPECPARQETTITCMQVCVRDWKRNSRRICHWFALFCFFCVRITYWHLSINCIYFLTVVSRVLFVLYEGKLKKFKDKCSKKRYVGFFLNNHPALKSFPFMRSQPVSKPCLRIQRLA